MGVIEQVARYDDGVAEVRFARITKHREEIATRIPPSSDKVTLIRPSTR